MGQFLSVEKRIIYLSMWVIFDNFKYTRYLLGLCTKFFLSNLTRYARENINYSTLETGFNICIISNQCRFVDKYFKRIRVNCKGTRCGHKALRQIFPFATERNLLNPKPWSKTPFKNTTQYAIVNRETNSDEIIYLLTEKKTHMHLWFMELSPTWLFRNDYDSFRT